MASIHSIAAKVSSRQLIYRIVNRTALRASETPRFGPLTQKYKPRHVVAPDRYPLPPVRLG
jgi:hypothetical protein